jgi:hypothetical protein
MSRPGLGSLLLLGAAAFGVYKYSKMSEQQKQDLMNKGKDLVGKGKKIVNENLDTVLGKKHTSSTVNGTV